MLTCSSVLWTQTGSACSRRPRFNEIKISYHSYMYSTIQINEHRTRLPIRSPLLSEEQILYQLIILTDPYGACSRPSAASDGAPLTHLDLALLYGPSSHVLATHSPTVSISLRSSISSPISCTVYPGTAQHWRSFTTSTIHYCALIPGPVYPRVQYCSSASPLASSTVLPGCDDESTCSASILSPPNAPRRPCRPYFGP